MREPVRHLPAHSRPVNWAVLLGILLALWLPRGLSLDRFVTVDEPKWLVRSANFYHALATGNFADTFQREHPGVTITWAGTAGFLWRFPGYYKIAPAANLTPTRFHTFLESHGIASLDLLAAGRFFVVLAIVSALCASFWLARRLVGTLPAAFAFLLVAFDPFLVAHSRFLHLDGLMSALSLLSLAAFACYLYAGRRRGDLLLSGVVAGLAWLTKSPAFFLAPFVGFMALLDWVLRRRSGGSDGTVRAFWREMLPLAGWFAIGAAVFVLLWPAMWVDPLGSLSRVFSQATLYASEGHEITSYFYGKIYPGGDLPAYFYPLIYLWRATPLTLVGLLLASAALLFPKRWSLPDDQRKLIVFLLLFALLFTIFMSLGAKKFDRYLLPVFAPLDLVAALGWLALGQKLRAIFPKRRIVAGDPLRGERSNLGDSSETASSGKVRSSRSDSGEMVKNLLLGAVLLGQLAGVVFTYPYYLNFYNPLMGGHRAAAQTLLVGWGEGLDQAARYLNSAPRTEKTRLVAWYGDGSVSYFFDGVTVPVGLDFLLTDLRKTDYVLIYRNQWQRGLPTPEFLAYFEALSPVYVVRLDGVEYVRVYDIP